MRAFLKKISFIVLVSFLSVLLAVYIMENDLVYSSKRNLFESEKNNIECLITGSSHTNFGLNPNLFPIKTINIAEVSKPLKIDIKIIEKYINQLKKLKFVIIPIDYFSFSYTGERESFSKKYYYHWNLIDKFTTNNFFSNIHFFNCGCFSGLKEIFRNHSNNSLMGYAPHFGEFSSVSNIEQFKLSKHKIEIWHQYFTDTLESYNTKMSILNLILQLNKKNIKTVLVTMPVSRTLQKFYNKNIMNQNALLLESILSQTGAIYINLLTYKVFENDALFFDCDHLNNNGANIASNIIKNIILNNQLR